MRIRFSILAFAIGVFLSSLAGISLAAEIDDLVKKLQDTSAAVRADAAHSLGAMGESARPAAKALAETIVDQDANVRRAALKAIRNLKLPRSESVPMFAKVFGDADPAVAAQACLTLAEVGEAALPFMIDALKDERSRYWACLVISDIGPKAKQAVPALIEAIDSKELDTRGEVIMTIAAIGPDAKAAIPALLKELQHENEGIVISATYALGHLGDGSDAVTRAIAKGVRGESDFLRVASAWSLAKLHIKEDGYMKRALPILLQGLKNKDKQVRRLSAEALVDLKPIKNSSPAVRAIALAEFTKILNESSPEMIAELVETVGSMGSEALPGMIKMLEFEQIRPYVARSIAKVGPEASTAVPELVKYLSDSDAASRGEILFALGEIGPAAASAVPEIVKRLDDENEQVRYSAVFAIGKMGTKAQAAAESLQKQLDSEDEFFRLTNAWALVNVDPQGKETASKTLPILMEGLKHERDFVRIEVAEALGMLGAEAKSALPALEALSKDPHQDVQDAAKAAIKKISNN